jgi:hypothetical protein
MLKPEIQVHLETKKDVDYLMSVISPSEAEVAKNAKKAAESFKIALRGRN